MRSLSSSSSSLFLTAVDFVSDSLSPPTKNGDFLQQQPETKLQQQQPLLPKPTTTSSSSASAPLPLQPSLLLRPSFFLSAASASSSSAAGAFFLFLLRLVFLFRQLPRAQFRNNPLRRAQGCCLPGLPSSSSAASAAAADPLLLWTVQFMQPDDGEV